MEKEDMDLFDVGDPFEFWSQQACRLSGKLKISPDFVNEAIAIIKGSFGEQWLRDSFENKARNTPIPMPKHPLIQKLLTPTESQVISIYELAVYIKRLLQIKNLDKVLQMCVFRSKEPLIPVKGATPLF
ncbi:MAG: hypothetical protein ABII89_05030 [Candidatus Omnitrophota bacterium]